jgi:hypothetical protein
MPAGGQPTSLERHELVGTGKCEDASLDQPRPSAEERRGIDEVVKGNIAHERSEADGRADDGVGTQERHHCESGPAQPHRQCRENPQGGQAGREHHRGDHHLPGDQEQRDGDPQGWTALDERVVVQRAGVARQLGEHGDQPGSADGRRHDDQP